LEQELEGAEIVPEGYLADLVHRAAPALESSMSSWVMLDTGRSPPQSFALVIEVLIRFQLSIWVVAVFPSRPSFECLGRAIERLYRDRQLCGASLDHRLARLRLQSMGLYPIAWSVCQVGDVRPEVAAYLEAPFELATAVSYWHGEHPAIQSIR